MSDGNMNRELKKAEIQFTSGGAASFVEVAIVYPLDLLKTRLQLQSPNQPGERYDGVLDCVKKMYKHEGITSFYKGIAIPMMSEAPKRAVKFVLYEQFKKIFLFGSKTPTPLTHSLSGLLAGVIEGILVNPFEVIKLNLQVNRSVKVPSAWSLAKEIARKGGLGLNGLNRGLMATASRNGCFNMVYFGIYYGEKSLIPECQDPWQECYRKFSTGFMSAVISTFISSPFDMAKSRIQGPQPVPGAVKYKTTIKSITMIVKEEGFLALYTGMKLKLLRVGTGGALILAGYDYIYIYLTRKLLPEDV